MPDTDGESSCFFKICFSSSGRWARAASLSSDEDDLPGEPGRFDAAFSSTALGAELEGDSDAWSRVASDAAFWPT